MKGIHFTTVPGRQQGGTVVLLLLGGYHVFVKGIHFTTVLYTEGYTLPSAPAPNPGTTGGIIVEVVQSRARDTAHILPYVNHVVWC